MPAPTKVLLRAALVVTALFSAPAPAAESGPNLLDTGPKSLVVTYNVAPHDRPALRRILETTGVRQLQNWKKQGVLESYHVLFNRNAESDTWDAITLLQFARYTDIVKWNEIERTYPGGLPTEAAKLVTAIHTSSADLTRQGPGNGTGSSAGSGRDQGQPVFMIIPYTYTPSTPEYLSYLDAYVIPQVDGWKAEGILDSYDIFVTRYQTNRAWDALFVFEYKDEEALGKRAQIMAKVRAHLKETNADWKALSERKQDIRKEHEAVLAEEILPQ